MESIDKILADLKAENAQKTQPSPFQKPSTSVAKSYPAKSTPIDSLITEIRGEYQKQEQQVSLAQKERAQQWLNGLNEQSDDWLWFEEFARSYASKLDAAMDYLRALKQI